LFAFQLERQVIAHTEQTNDYQDTIRKFRELVQQLQVRIELVYLLYILSVNFFSLKVSKSLSAKNLT